MKIGDVATHLWNPGGGKNFLYVKITTDCGIAGWGESYTQADRDKQVETHIHQLARYLDGRDPFHIRHLMHVIREDFATKRGGMDLHCAVSGIEIALWDIVGKSLGRPIYDLLGGPVRPRLKLYANGWSGGAQSPDEYGEAAAALVEERGFKALKFDPFPGPWREYPEKEALDEAVQVVSAVRDAVGPSVDLLIEVHRRLAPMNAIRVARRLEPLAPYWFEEPCPPDDLAAIKEVKENTTIPVVTGEAMYTMNEFRDVCSSRAVDIINPDICNTGGIWEITKVAAMAQAHHIAISPHGWNSTGIGCAAAVQASAGMPNFLMYEYMVGVEAASREVTRGYLEPEGGYIELPKGSGLGVDVDEIALASKPYAQLAKRNIRQVKDERQWH